MPGGERSPHAEDPSQVGPEHEPTPAEKPAGGDPASPAASVERKEEAVPPVEVLLQAERENLRETRSRASALLRKGVRNVRSVITAIGLAQAALIGSDGLSRGHEARETAAAPEPVKNREPNRLDRPMFDPAASAFLRSHEGAVSLSWATPDSGGEKKMAGEAFEKQEAIEFLPDQAPTVVEISWEANQSIEPGVIAERAVDGHGNVVKLLRATREGKTVIVARVDVSPPFSNGSESEAYDVSIDLSAFGGPKLEDVARGGSIPSFGRTGPDNAYRLHTAAPDFARMESAYAEHDAEVAGTIAETEALFGLKPGEAVQRIWIADAKEANSFALQNATGEKGTMLLSDEMFKEEGSAGRAMPPDQRRLMVRHETLHLLDRKFSFSERNQDLPAKFTPAFREKMSEGKYLPDAWGGHAAENERELFASLMDDVLDPRWEKGTERQTMAELKQHHEAVSALLARLQATPGLKDAPVLRVLEQRKKYLEVHFQL